MKLTIATEKFKDMVSRATKGVGNNKLIPLTSLIAIELKDSELTLITTDATNYLYIKEDKIVGEDFYAVVDANVFSKLISKITSESITLQIRKDLTALEVIGNGTYRLELPIDENGEFIKYPDPYANLVVDNDMSDSSTINKTTANVILETIKPALATTLENPCYTGYYMGNNVVATDTYKIASMNVGIFDTPKLISAELFDLLAVMRSEKIAVTVADDTIMYSTPDCIIIGKLMEGLEDFAIDPIMELVNTEFDSSCAVAKSAVLQLLDRLSLFVGPYDKNAIHLTFTNNGLQVSSKATSGVEIIPYVMSDNFRDFTCAVDIQMLTQEIKAISSDVIELHYGELNAIKFVDGNITIIVALLEEDEDDE